MNVTWLKRSHLSSILTLENTLESGERWSEKYFSSVIQQNNVTAMVVEDTHDNVIGYFFYEVHKNRLSLMKFVGENDVRDLMLQKLFSKLSNTRPKLIWEVRESNLPLQLWLQVQDFKAVKVLRQYFTDTNEDAFVFEWNLVEHNKKFDFSTKTEPIIT